MINKKIKNVYRMLKYAYVKDIDIIGINIKYGKNKRQYYKVYKQNTNKPTVFFVHGGGWSKCNPSLYSGVGKYFFKHGYTVVLAGYRLVPIYKYPIQIEDVFKAFRHYIKHNKNNNGIVVCGYSAGAEIASHLAFDTKRQQNYQVDKSILKGFISISGVLDFNKCISNKSKKLINKYIYKINTENCNPINLINKNSTISTLCIHGDKDTLISIENSKSFINTLSKVNPNSYLEIIEDAEHEDTIDMVRGKGNKYSKYIFEFLEKII